MSLLNLGLQHCSYARTACEVDIEQKIRSLNTMKALRSAAEEDENIKKEWLGSTRLCKEKIAQRFSTLEQKGKKVNMQKAIANEQDVLTLQNIVCDKAGYKMSCTTKAEYNKTNMNKFRERLEQGALQQELYVTEIRGRMERVPLKLRDFFKYPIPQPWKEKNTDKDFMQTEDLLRLQRDGKILDSRFIPSFRNSKAKKTCAEGSKSDALVKQTDQQIFTASRAIGSISCEECGKKRIIYARANVVNEKHSRRLIIDKIEGYCKTTPYLCGFTLINSSSHPLFDRVFARENIRCRVPIQSHYYSDLVCRYTYPLICLECGTE